MCACKLPLCVFVCACASLFKSTTARRHLNLPTWQLAPLITKSNTHQWMSNEAFLRELWLTMGLGSTPQVTPHIMSYLGILLNIQRTVFETLKSCHKPDRILISDKQLQGDNSSLPSVLHTRSQPQNLEKPHSEWSIPSKLVLNKGVEGKWFLKSIGLHSPCLTLEAYTHSW